MSFGIDAGISRTTTNSVETAQKTDEDGVITEETSYGGMEETVEESFTTTFTNAATNGQVGNSSTGLVSNHTNIEANDAYAREQKTTRKPLA